MSSVRKFPDSGPGIGWPPNAESSGRNHPISLKLKQHLVNAQYRMQILSTAKLEQPWCQGRKQYIVHPVRMRLHGPGDGLVSNVL